MKKYSVCLKSRWVNPLKPNKLKYTVSALNENKAILKAFELSKEQFGEPDYYTGYSLVDNVTCIGE
jgi:hypothetical protein